MNFFFEGTWNVLLVSLESLPWVWFYGGSFIICRWVKYWIVSNFCHYFNIYFSQPGVMFRLGPTACVTLVYLLRKVVCHVEISQSTMPTTMFLVLLEILWWVVHWGNFLMFRPMVQELLNVEWFCNWKFNIVKNQYF